jgi:predicted amidophosphoribosyltransferase
MEENYGVCEECEETISNSELQEGVCEECVKKLEAEEAEEAEECVAETTTITEGGVQ